MTRKPPSRCPGPDRARRAMNGVYLLVEGPGAAGWVIQVPDGIEEDDFRETIRQQTGLRTRGPVYVTTLAALAQEMKTAGVS